MKLEEIKKLKLGKGEILVFDMRLIEERGAREICKFLNVQAILLPDMEAIGVLRLPRKLSKLQKNSIVSKK